MDYKKLFKFAMLSGEIMLKNGAETYRVEDTINRILATSNFQVVESFVTPTGIFATLDDPTIDLISYIKRVDTRTINLMKIELANGVSRKYCASELSLDNAYNLMEDVGNKPPYSNIINSISTCFVAGFFTIMFEGSIFDMLSSLIIGFCLSIVINSFSRFNTTRFFINIIGGSIISILALVFTILIPIGTDINLIIIGSIMPLVPGVAITNGIRDTIEGNLVSGLSRIIEAIFLAASIAIGVGAILKIYYLVSGGI